MKLSELIVSVGDENIVFQNIITSSPDLRIGRSNFPGQGGKITFSTDEAKVRDLQKQGALGAEGEWVGLVVWLPKSKLPNTKSGPNKL